MNNTKSLKFGFGETDRLKSFKDVFKTSTIPGFVKHTSRNRALLV